MLSTPPAIARSSCLAITARAAVPTASAPLAQRRLIVTPGVRPKEKAAAAKDDDQARTATPAEAIRAGADFLVVGRPITAALDPRAATQAIVDEIIAAK